MLAPLSTAFPDVVAGSWFRRGVAWMGTSIPTRDAALDLLNPLRHNASPQKLDHFDMNNLIKKKNTLKKLFGSLVIYRGLTFFKKI